MFNYGNQSSLTPLVLTPLVLTPLVLSLTPLVCVNVLLQDVEGNTLTDENGKALFKELTLEEKQNLQQSADGRVHIANNGINNTIEAAAKYANQHSTADGGPQYLIYFPIADNSLSELIIAGYQKVLENEYTGFTNATQETIYAMQDYGQSGLHLDSHSRGGLTTGNALEYIGDTSSVGVLAGTRMNFVGSAYNALQADNLLGNLQGRDLLTDMETSLLRALAITLGKPINITILTQPVIYKGQHKAMLFSHF